MAAKKAKTEKRETIRLIFWGLRPWLKGGKYGYVYVPLPGDFKLSKLTTKTVTAIECGGSDHTWSTKTYSKPLGKWIVPGHIVEIESDGASAVFVDTAKDVDQCIPAVCEELRAMHKTHELTKTMAAQAKKDKARDIDLERLELLREAYWRLSNKNERAVLLGRIYNYITTRPRP